MRLRADQLNRHLQQKLAPLYYVCGDEPFQMQESCDAIRLSFRDNGFTEREVMQVDRSFDWQELLSSANSMSLFAEKKLIELRLSSPKPGDAGSKALRAYVENLNPDTALLISSPKVDASTQKTKWFKELESVGVILQLWPLDSQQLPYWIEQRLKKHGLNADRDAVALIAERVEGNMLAAAQEVDKLALLVSNENISAETVAKVVADSSRYNVYNLADHALAGRAREALRALNGLRAEGSDTLHILWALSRDIHLLSDANYACQQGQSIDAFLKRQRVFDKRIPLIKGALKRLNGDKKGSKNINELFVLAQHIDHSIKGMAKGSAWDGMAELCLRLGGINSLKLTN